MSAKAAKIDVLIAHAEWAPGRRESLARTIDSIGGEALILASTVKEHASVWAMRLWRAGLAASKADWVVFLNDDVEVCPDFWGTCSRAFGVLPIHAASVALHTTAEEAKKTEENWLRAYWTTGPGYAVARHRLPSLIEFGEQRIADGFFGGDVNEDRLMMQWAWAFQEPTWHTVPALVRHDVGVKSTLGYDHHPARQSIADWGRANPADIDWFWRLEESDGSFRQPPLVECPWMAMAVLAGTKRRNYQPWVCVGCNQVDPSIKFDTGGAICRHCLAKAAAWGILIR